MLKDQINSLQCSENVKQCFDIVDINHEALSLRNIAGSWVMKYFKSHADIDSLHLQGSLKNFIANEVIQVLNNPSRSHQ